MVCKRSKTSSPLHPTSQCTPPPACLYANQHCMTYVRCILRIPYVSPPVCLAAHTKRPPPRVRATTRLHYVHPGKPPLCCAFLFDCFEHRCQQISAFPNVLIIHRRLLLVWFCDLCNGKGFVKAEWLIAICRRSFSICRKWHGVMTTHPRAYGEYRFGYLILINSGKKG